MTSANLPAPILVTRPAELAQMIAVLSQQPSLAVDTESNSLFAYREQVCLIQFSVAGGDSGPSLDYLVDPLALDDLSSLGPIFANAGIEKVFHAAEYDLFCLKRDFGFEFNNLFDTMAAARILGRGEVGLGALLESEFGVRLDKRFQRANWGERPLGQQLLAYARLDTHYLLELRKRLYADLVRRGLWGLAEEDFRRMRPMESRPEDDKDNGGRQLDCWRVKGAYDLTPQQAAVLNELCVYRDQAARAMNRPLFKVINDQTLITLAQAAPQDSNSLGRLQGITPRLAQRHGQGLLAAIQRGLGAEPVHPPRNHRPNNGYLERLDGLRMWRKRAAQTMGVMSDVVLPRDLMLALAERNPRGREELGEVMREAPWRLEKWGEEILRVLRG
jgi:ribonuclease D